MQLPTKTTTKTKRLHFTFYAKQSLSVEVTGLEPATAWSQTRNATNCATPRIADAKVQKTFHIHKISFVFLFDNALFSKNPGQSLYASLYLFLGMCGHQGKSY